MKYFQQVPNLSPAIVQNPLEFLGILRVSHSGTNFMHPFYSRFPRLASLCDEKSGPYLILAVPVRLVRLLLVLRVGVSVDV